ncbi:hypothetical protein QQ054_36720 [Oscillatoria amoena NRMC-F 0135]|nr:hypothetical protein [Oscillatoria amoena NRMC-F 0135]
MDLRTIIRTGCSVMVLAGVLLVSGCIPWEIWEPYPVEGFKPVFGVAEELAIEMRDPQEVSNPGKIYVYGKYLLVNERNIGFHVFDNEDPASPVNIAFVYIPNNFDVAIQNNKLYADHIGYIVSLNFNSDWNLNGEEGRIKINEWEHGMLPPSGYYYECIEPGAGTVVGWEAVEITNPSCYAR